MDLAIAYKRLARLLLMRTEKVQKIIEQKPILHEIGENVDAQVWRAHYPIDSACFKMNKKRMSMDALMAELASGNPNSELDKELKKNHHEKVKSSIGSALSMVLQRQGCTAYKAGYRTHHANVSIKTEQNLVSKYQIDAGRKWARSQVWPWPGKFSVNPPITHRPSAVYAAFMNPSKQNSKVYKGSTNKDVIQSALEMAIDMERSDECLDVYVCGDSESYQYMHVANTTSESKVLKLRAILIADNRSVPCVLPLAKHAKLTVPAGCTIAFMQVMASRPPPRASGEADIPKCGLHANVICRLSKPSESNPRNPKVACKDKNKITFKNFALTEEHVSVRTQRGSAAAAGHVPVPTKKPPPMPDKTKPRCNPAQGGMVPLDIPGHVDGLFCAEHGRLGRLSTSDNAAGHSPSPSQDELARKAGLERCKRGCTHPRLILRTKDAETKEAAAAAQEAGPVTSPSHSPKHKKARTTHSAAHAASATEEEAEPARSRGDGAEASKSSKVQEKQEHPRREKSRGYKPVLVTARKIPEYRIEDADKFVKGKRWIVLDPGESTAFTGLLVEPDGSCFELRFGAGLSRFIDWKKKKVDSARSAMDLEKDENERKAKTNEYQRTLHELEATKNKARHTIVNHITALADVVLVPRLAVARMTQRKARGKPMGTDFRRRMLGLGVATMTDLLQSKCENTGIKYFTVSEYLTSKGCVCGAVHGSLGFSRHFKCPKCHATRHRDLGACFMILLDFLIAMRRIAAEGSGSSDVGGAGPPKPKRKSHQNSKAPPPGATSKADTKAPEDEARRKASIVKGNKKKVDEEDEDEEEEEEEEEEEDEEEEEEEEEDYSEDDEDEDTDSVGHFEYDANIDAFVYTDTDQRILKIVKRSEVMVWLEKTKDTPEGAYKAVVISLDGANGNLEVRFEGDNNTYSVHVDSIYSVITSPSLPQQPGAGGAQHP
ncbi:transposase [Pycnococcus provasolii]